MDKFANFKFSFVFLWFIAAYLALIFAIFSVTYLSSTRQFTSQSQNFKLYAALPETSIQVQDTIVKEDARAKIVADFFKGYNSPLQAFAQVFIQVADKYSLDYRLLPAISMQESNGGKKIINNSFNPFGYGIYDSNVLKFASYEEAIERVGKGLRNDYFDQGLTTPESIMAKYTPPALSKGGNWAKGVSSFMIELR